jgi:formylglycine-generating enzyme required for sulfatase activity
MSLVRIPGGTFTMGQERIAEAEAPNPPHVVRLSPFQIGRHPVTNAEYRAFVDATGAALPLSAEHTLFGDPERPVVGVGWKEAVQFCAWAGGTLPTEAQWELTARGLDGRRYPWGDSPPDDALACFAQDWNHGAPSRIGAHPSGASPFGCEEVAGSVWEWCLDAFRPDAHRERTTTDPCVSGDATRVRPIRGGCWRSIECKLQAAYRNWAHEAARHTTIGFRLCVPG